MWILTPDAGFAGHGYIISIPGIRWDVIFYPCHRYQVSLSTTSYFIKEGQRTQLCYDILVNSNRKSYTLWERNILKNTPLRRWMAQPIQKTSRYEMIYMCILSAFLLNLSLGRWYVALYGYLCRCNCVIVSHKKSLLAYVSTHASVWHQWDITLVHT